MSISQDSTTTIVCREVFDETSHPSNEEVLDYARRLGIDPDAEPHLLDLAREGLMAALPKGWSPCFHESTGAWYYYETSTGITTWEHPLDAVYKELVEQARAGNRQMSIEEDSKTTAKELESHEEATLPKELIPAKETSASKPTAIPTKIPTKLAPLKKLDRNDAIRRKDVSSHDRYHSRQESDSRSDNLMSDRAARDYTNLRFQDPKFYECPKLLESVAMTNTTTTTVTTTVVRKELDLKEVLKRSESLSPRHEKDWEQLSSKFSSEENIIDIDKLSVSALVRSERTEKFEKEKHPSQFGQQKELTLSGGGSMFLKSNRSRETTPSQDGNKVEEFRGLTTFEEANNVVVDKLKSILREKQSDDADDKPVDEERKSVRFDLEKEVDIKFTYPGSEDDWDTESEEQNVRISAVVTSKITGSILSSQETVTRVFKDLSSKEDDSEDRDQTEGKKSSSSERTDSAAKVSKVVGRRFVVQNVTENEHLSQVAREKLSSEGSLEIPCNKFENIKNIDLVSKSETDSLARSSDSDDIRRSKAIVEKARRTSLRFSKERTRRTDDDESSDASKIYQNYDSVRLERHGKPRLGYSRSFDDMKMKMSKDHEREIEELKKDFETKLDQTKRELEQNFIEQKFLLQQNLQQRLEELKREMAEKEEQEVQKLIAEMDEARLENLKKVRAELEVCYEKEKQEILENLKTELDERKKELLELRNQQMEKLATEHERDLGEEKLAKLECELTKQHSEKIEAMKGKLEKEFEEMCAELRTQRQEKIGKMTREHDKYLAEILRDYKIDENLTRKMHMQQLEKIREDFSRDVKKAKKQSERALQQESIDFEKMRCEKRLLQEKYTALKEKYTKLKNDFRLAVERKNKRKEGYSTPSETERSTSTRTRTDRTESSEQNTPVKNTRSDSLTSAKQQEGQGTNDQSQAQNETKDSRSQKTTSGFQKPIPTTPSKNAAKFESDDTTTASESNANMMKRRKSFTKKAGSTTKLSGNGSNNNNNNHLENPVENIRKQLEKLEDLGDQLPSNEMAYTLRYPFQDKSLYTLYFD